ncbi:MAG TPA: tRNA (adenosine(37)-N6)-threonylcarbamoyltransferase complex ATPase subunit type 1 TsaE [Bacteroidia bacterium]|nr:tRNA (adenosine(37)-N6)-threonylcarbamoyltransferase complex ATPase subunit type 1 TsaE [Bacteroidia bacterium]
MDFIFECKSLEGLDEIAEKILSKLGDFKIVAVYGVMGAGKTTLIKSLCKKLNVTDSVTSPTFAIMNEYASGNKPVYHFDFYRINSESEAFDLGYENFLFNGNYCFIEWPEKIKNLLPGNRAEIHISEENGARYLKLTV